LHGEIDTFKIKGLGAPCRVTIHPCRVAQSDPDVQRAASTVIAPTLRLLNFSPQWLGITLSVLAVRATGAPVEFNRDIRPILSDKCYACHGPDSASREVDLRLDMEDQAKLDRGGYAAIVPGKLDESALVHRITSEDESERMPPVESNKTLSPREIDLLKQWVSEGAPWQLSWSYLPPQRATVPVVRDTSWPKNWIDNFVLARLEAEYLKPATEAGRRTMIRRLYVDLIGLPPTPTEYDEIIADERPNAYERLVDRLLESPHFGERMAMYWLDLVRFANTVGYHGDQEHYISPYRDYVINAFNANMPFDQFTREQLAGDLLSKPTIDQKIASGYNRLLQTSHEGGVQPKEYMAIYSADHVRNISAVWMAATMGCAQCHDHKFDPFTARDFYSMAAFFADVDENKHLTKGSDVSPTIRAPEMEVYSAEERARLDKLELQMKRLKKQIATAKSSTNSKTSKIASDKLADIEADIEKFKKHSRRTMITVAMEPREIRVLPRGNWLDDSGEIVQPAIPQFLGKLKPGHRATRLELANWLTDAKQGTGGQTARVMANRLWYLCFGRGIAGVLEDFGGQGEPPDNAPLLDSLAVEFVESGWDIKHVLKLIVMSRAYRQSSAPSPELLERDPLNKLMARQGQYRYPAESVRDTALLISGLLVPTIGGDSVRPYQPAGYYKHLNFPIREYKSDTDEQQWRRGVYMHWQRQYLHPMLKAFDAPSREECTVQRPRSNTALAALVLLNDPTFTEAARAFAGRIVKEGGRTTSDRLNFAFREAVSRPADTEEQQVLDALLTRGKTYYKNNPKKAEQLLKVGLAPQAKGIDASELASWTIVARTVLNLNEVFTRN
jgi:Protein of unknown function (DUF1549)/Protein of unknown function (DUF1553)/Planctomycete cytochrome C